MHHVNLQAILHREMRYQATEMNNLSSTICFYIYTSRSLIKYLTDLYTKPDKIMPRPKDVEPIRVVSNHRRKKHSVLQTDKRYLRLYDKLLISRKKSNCWYIVLTQFLPDHLYICQRPGQCTCNFNGAADLFALTVTQVLHSLTRKPYLLGGTATPLFSWLMFTKAHS